MFIKSINNVVGYKDLPNGFNIEFNENKTYIVGANFQRKTTVGSLFNWCLTGTSLNGKEKEQVANDTKRVSNVIVDITFVDNFGIEHRLIRDKGKNTNLTFDGREIEQETLAQFYHDKDVFLAAHNPYYFMTLELKDQKKLFRKILPSIPEEKVFNLLSKEEKNIIGEPISNLASYTDLKNSEIDNLEKEYNKNLGTIDALRNIALEQTGNIIEYYKEQELQKLKEQYELIAEKFSNNSLESLKNSIDSLNRRIEEIINEKLVQLVNDYKKQNEQYKVVDCQESKCPSCKQMIKDSELKENLKKHYKNEMIRLQEQANKLRADASGLDELKKEKIEIFNKLNTSDMKALQVEKDNLKEQIEILEEEKSSTLLHNQEVQLKMQRVQQAKEQLSICDKRQNEIQEKLIICKEQKKIADKLKRIVIETQKEMIRKYLNKVDIEFSKINKTDGKITECCNILYEGRDFKKLSKSQQNRAALEVSNVFNNISGINAPIFFDDAESTTDIQEIPNTQLIISLVIKYNRLEILYDYEDVLDRREKSIKKEIEEQGCYEIPLVA